MIPLGVLPTHGETERSLNMRPGAVPWCPERQDMPQQTGKLKKSSSLTDTLATPSWGGYKYCRLRSWGSQPGDKGAR